MQSGESIYNLIPPPEVQQARPPMHKSQHPGTVDPAKFGLGPRRATATFGRAPGDVKPETSKFLKKNTGVLNATANTRASPPERLSRGDACRVPHELRAATENHARCSKTGRTALGLDCVSLASDDERVERAKRARFSSRPPSAVVVADSARRVARGTSSTRAVADPDPTPPPARKFSVDSSSSASRKTNSRGFRNLFSRRGPRQ